MSDDKEVNQEVKEQPKKAYEGGEIVYWLKGEISQDDSTLIRNAKRVFNEKTLPHVEDDATAVVNVKLAMLAGKPADPVAKEGKEEHRRIDDGAVDDNSGRFVPPVATPTGPGNEGERANTPERTPSGKPVKPKDAKPEGAEA